MILAASDKDISEIKKRIKELIKEMEKDKSFWEEFLG
jgi:tRNA(Ser,Leu) C12 N-acetylase TAN1